MFFVLFLFRMKGSENLRRIITEYVIDLNQ